MAEKETAELATSATKVLAEEMRKRELVARHDARNAGPREYEVRVRFTQLATTLNLRPKDPDWTRAPSLETALDSAAKLIALMERDDLFDAPFRSLIRQNVALMNAALPHTVEAIALSSAARDDAVRLHDKVAVPPTKGASDAEKATYKKAVDALQKAAAASSKLAKVELINQTIAGAPAWKKWLEDAKSPQDARTAYNLTCYYAARGEDDKALAALKVASRSPALMAGAMTDPVLKKVMAEVDFRKVVAASPRSDYWAVPPFTDLKDKLARAGIRQVRDLATTKGDAVYEIATFLDVQPIEMKRLIGLGGWFGKIETATKASKEKNLAGFGAELAAAMLDAGIESPEAAEREWPVETELHRNKGFGKFIAEKIESKFGAKLELPQMKVFIDAVATRPKAVAAKPVRTATRGTHTTI